MSDMKRETLETFADRIVDIVQEWDTPELEYSAAEKQMRSTVKYAIKAWTTPPTAMEQQAVEALEAGDSDYGFDDVAAVAAALAAAADKALDPVREYLKHHDDGLAARKHGDILAHFFVSNIRQLLEPTDD